MRVVVVSQSLPLHYIFDPNSPPPWKNFFLFPSSRAFPLKPPRLLSFPRKAVEKGDLDSSMSRLEFLELKRELESMETPKSSGESSGLAVEEEEEEKERTSGLVLEEEKERVGKSVKVFGSRRQMVRRSGLLAKQVISVRSACRIGFVSQLWVDTSSWLVVVVEVRSNILSGENEKLLLEDVFQVGDVVLVQDESVIENELKLVGLDTLVGYNVVTSGRRKVGKVRGFTFNINTGEIESLELDSFGMSIIPTSLVSTYSLFVEDVLEVVPDTVVVQDAAFSRIQRLTKGLWGAHPMTSPADDNEDYDSFRRRRRRSAKDQRSRAKIERQNLKSKMKEIDEEWDMPMEY